MRRTPLLLIVAVLLSMMGAGQAQAFHLGKPVAPCWLIAHQAVDPSAQTITVVNQANVKPGNLCRVELAVQQQALQLRAAWGTPPIRFGGGGWRVHLERPLALDLAGIAGMHGAQCVADCTSIDSTPTYEPTAWVSSGGACLDENCVRWVPWSFGFSHEMMELLVNPYGQTYAYNGQIDWSCSPRTFSDHCDTGREIEVCDPLWTRGAYWLDGVQVSRFTDPAYWLS